MYGSKLFLASFDLQGTYIIASLYNKQTKKKKNSFCVFAFGFIVAKIVRQLILWLTISITHFRRADLSDQRSEYCRYDEKGATTSKLVRPKCLLLNVS